MSDGSNFWLCLSMVFVSAQVAFFHLTVLMEIRRNREVLPMLIQQVLEEPDESEECEQWYGTDSKSVRESGTEHLTTENGTL